MAVEIQLVKFAMLDWSEEINPVFRMCTPVPAEMEYLKRAILRDVESVHRQARRHHRHVRDFWESLCEAVESLFSCCSNPEFE
mmetsp:Transcript_20942/g.34901  ORF Transcript_20942/g.34901 Transcript_20942/m.34901 type:complete len:83 (-) Transcript_20942:41-289(-)